jgi:tetratricopeptide (TPR) repeat protein
LQVYLAWGNTLVEVGSPEEAIIKFQEVSKHDPYAPPEAYVGLGNAFIQQDKIGDAVANYQKAIGITPRNGDAYQGWGKALMARQQPEEALNKFKRAIELNSYNASYYYNTGNALIEQEQHKKAAEYYEKARKFDPFGEIGRKAGEALKEQRGRIE